MSITNIDSLDLYALKFPLDKKYSIIYADPPWIYSPIEKHSKKPDEIRDRIVDLMGPLPKIELFARERSDGWDSWGDEL